MNVIFKVNVGLYGHYEFKALLNVDLSFTEEENSTNSNLPSCSLDRNKQHENVNLTFAITINVSVIERESMQLFSAYIILNAYLSKSCLMKHKDTYSFSTSSLYDMLIKTCFIYRLQKSVSVLQSL